MKLLAVVAMTLAACTRVVVEPSPCEQSRPGAEAAGPTASSTATVDAGGRCPAADGGGPCPDAATAPAD